MGRIEEEKTGFLDNLQEYVILQQVASEFGLRMRGYRKQGRGYVLETDEGVKVVRSLRHSLDEYSFACNAAEFLRGQGFSRLPHATWSPKGSPVVEINGLTYTMQDWVLGSAADLRNICLLTQAVEMLAWFHRCAQNFKPVIVPRPRDDWGSWRHRFAERIQDLYRLEDRARAESDDHFARAFLKYFDDLLVQAAKSLQELEASPYERLIDEEKKRGGLCHRDYSGQNLILRDDGALFLSDFDDMALDSRLEDLGKFLARLGQENLERTLFILQVYHGVNPISAAEVRCLAIYLGFPSEYWSIANTHFDGKPAERHDLKRAVERILARRALADHLLQADLGFLAGGGPLYNLGFANLPEVPSGKDWAGSVWTGAEVVADGDWWQTQPMEQASEMSNEPVIEEEPLGQVLDDIGEVGVGGYWPNGADEYNAPIPSEEAYHTPEVYDVEVINPPVAAVEIKSFEEVPEPAAEQNQLLTWRPFPAPVARKG